MPNPGKEPCEVDDVECIRETDDAILVQLHDGEEKWIPKSVLHDDSEVTEKGDEGTLVVHQWFADKEDLG